MSAYNFGDKGTNPHETFH